MYIPKHFKMNEEEVYDFMETYGFATLYSQHNGEPCATHLPLTYEESEHALYGHFSRANEQWKDAENQQTLAVFQGPHCYISPSWYETNKAVPTWNYVSVHVYGTLEMIEDSQTTYDTLHDLVTKYESPDSTYDLNHLEHGFIEGMSKGIVPFRLNITKIEAKAKLSQNHSVERQERVIKQLENSSQQDDRIIASLMKKNIK
ncbi:FMN-binding negative transcriptional regulator [Halobacillus sp. A5]|uniref:FMN-binding negative transcriptional regulator n=1 Tax=Halobacillus sp. A5 TaxID=2880263 RepID=UPI0020A6D03D|nr:FMN-binding negative transcriptional regulator [Halobacillus sp. A5]MCP3027624.1 FMN-binding negative transcriptional regulator [Halobacillus sp. A5]